MLKTGTWNLALVVLSYYNVLWIDSDSMIIIAEVHMTFAVYFAYANMMTDFLRGDKYTPRYYQKDIFWDSATCKEVLMDISFY